MMPAPTNTKPTTWKYTPSKPAEKKPKYVAKPPRVRVEREWRPKGPMMSALRVLRQKLAAVDKGRIPFTKAVGLKKEDALSFAAYSVGCAKKNDLDTAVAAGHLAIACDADSFDAWLAYGCALAKRKHDAPAVAALRCAAKLRPDNLAAHVHLGEVLLRGLDYAGASAEFGLVMALDPKAETPEGARAQALVARTMMTLGR